MSELPATLALVKGNQHLYYTSLHEKYGPVVRVSPDELSFVSVDAREEIYGLRVSRPDRALKNLFFRFFFFQGSLPNPIIERWSKHGEESRFPRSCWKCRWTDGRESSSKWRAHSPAEGTRLSIHEQRITTAGKFTSASYP